MKVEEDNEQICSLLEAAEDADDSQTAIELAEKILALDSNNVRAWLVRAEAETEDVSLALNAYRRAAEAGRIELGGEEFFLEEEGRFWEILESRPYMRARLGEALCLYEQGLAEETTAVLREMLRLNPADDQGARYILLTTLLELNLPDEALDLIEDYKGDTSPVWLYGKALADFVNLGPEMARPSRQRAVDAWPNVAAYLAQTMPLPDGDPDEPYAEADDEALCALEMRTAWGQYPKALGWLLEEVE